MYTYVACVSIPYGSNTGKVTDDISNLPVNQILQTYFSNDIIVTNSFVKGQFVFHLQDWFNELQSVKLPLKDWLAQLGARALPTTTKLPNLVRKYATWVDMRYQKFNSTPADSNKSPDREVFFSDAPDVLLTKADVDYPKLAKNALFTVNGYLHRQSAASNGLYLLNGCQSARIANDFNLGGIIFEKVSSLQTYNVEDAHILPAPDNVPYKDAVYLKAPVPLSGKSVGLVVGGILYYQDVNLEVVGEQVVKLQTSRIDWVNRYYQDSAFIDTRSLPTGIDPAYPYVIPTANLLADAFYKAYLQLPQSFWVVFDNPYITVETEPAETYRIPNTFVSPYEHPHPLLLDNGLFAEYIVQPATKANLLLTRVAQSRTSLVRTTGWKETNAAFDFALNSDQWRQSKGTLVKFSTL